MHPARGGRFAILAALVLTLGLTSCAERGESMPESIACDYLFRPDAGAADGEQSGTVTVDRGQDANMELPTMVLRVGYSTGQPDGDAVVIHIDDLSDEPVATYLYQHGGSGESLRRDLAGGHGFTGLLYTYHSGGVLQVWCAAADS